MYWNKHFSVNHFGKNFFFTVKCYVSVFTADCTYVTSHLPISFQNISEDILLFNGMLDLIRLRTTLNYYIHHSYNFLLLYLVQDWIKSPLKFYEPQSCCLCLPQVSFCVVLDSSTQPQILFPRADLVLISLIIRFPVYTEKHIPIFVSFWSLFLTSPIPNMVSLFQIRQHSQTCPSPKTYLEIIHLRPLSQQHWIKISLLYYLRETRIFISPLLSLAWPLSLPLGYSWLIPKYRCF